VQGVNEAALSERVIRIPAKHGGSEGKMKGLWERFKRDGIIDLRIDLQVRGG
jgi:hypothetical protein